MDGGKIYLSFWFPRVTVHLKEFYKFLMGEESHLKLDGSKLKNLRDNLQSGYVEFLSGDFNRLRFDMGAKGKKAQVEFTEDGMIILKKEIVNLKKDKELLKTYFRERLNPAVAYLFSQGAPFPKDLIKTRKILNFSLVFSGRIKRETLLELDGKKDMRLSFRNFEMYEKDNISILFLKNKNGLAAAENFIEYNGFIAENELQLGRYLDGHRAIWDSTTHIREEQKIRYKDFAKIRNRIVEDLKVVSLILARVKQMEDFISTRRKFFLSVFSDPKILETYGRRFDKLLSDQGYMTHLIIMTKDYLRETLDIISILYQENGQREFKIFNFLLFVSAFAALLNIGFKPATFDVSVFFSSASLIFLLSLLVYGLARYVYGHRRFELYSRKIVKG